MEPENYKQEFRDDNNADMNKMKNNHEENENKTQEQSNKPAAPNSKITVTTFQDHLDDLQKNTDEILQKMALNSMHRPVKISDNEFACDIWLFAKAKDNYYLKGIYRDGVLKKNVLMGYYKRIRENNSYYFIQERNNIIIEVEPHNMKDETWNYVKAINSPINIEYEGEIIFEKPEKLRETFLRQSQLVFNKLFLEQLPTHTKPILRDIRDAAFFCFKNTVVKVTKDGREALEYSNLGEYCIWFNQIINRDLEYFENYSDSQFAKFIQNVCDHDPKRQETLLSGIGYLMHNFTTPSRAQAVIAYDEEITDLSNPMGGTGKGVLGNALRQMRNVTSIDGKKFKVDDKFRYQRITDSTQIVWFDDVKAGFPFEVFNSVLTDGWDVEKKYQQETHISPEDSPKIFITSNSVLAGGGTTAKRRQHIAEFSNHYSKQIKNGHEEPILKEHGGLFFDKVDWSDDEWNKFYSLMLDSVSFYLKNGLIYCEPKGVQRNNLIQSTNDEFVSWVNDKNFLPSIKYYSKDVFEDFKKCYPAYSDIKQRNFTDWLKKYASVNNWKYLSGHSGDVITFSFIEHLAL